MALEGLIFDEGSALNNKLLELSMENQRVIANNLANADTPGYVRFKLDYQKKLASALESGDNKSIGDVKGKLVKDESGNMKLDGNNITVATEMTEMMQNSVLYSLLARSFTTRINILKSAITGTR
ncbi:MAG: flagellar basal-body rod protein FlgB [Lentisphaerae bacterium GWF2_44_16]|nr:MAG: flagellar basal-body rod protein FlgB [Lentisphaerae bacterium GWF2_44_16]